MSVGDEIRDFLLSRRARVSPEQAGIPWHGERRVAGLRREEVAQLAGVSVEYYTRLERGNARGYSDDVLTAVARALRLDDAEVEHLMDLVHAANARPGRQPRKGVALDPGVQRLLDAMTGIPAYVWNGRLDVLATNALGRALFAPMMTDGNQARFLFLDPAAREFFPDRERLAHDAVAVLRAEAGRNRQDERLGDLIRELSAGSAEFRELWAAYDLDRHRSGVKRFRHPVAGPLTVRFTALALIGQPGLRLGAGTPEPGSEEALGLLIKNGEP
ncbi:helix-turn-helix transcriptional regulator [Actinoplanes sp. NPDC051851]|uniref:helix-turn-helix domain-containing protein n=1 Tax=Actinoplanes sp. NPDC051851 TaxID=3154753 RepID=UPI00342838D8